MEIVQSARLAVLTLLMIAICIAPAAGLAGDVLDSPIRARFTLTDGAIVTGDVTEWDQNEIAGTFGRRAWSDLVAEDIWRLYRALMDDGDADQWVNLGRLLLIAEGGQDNAERAFTRALRLDPDAQPAIDEVRQRAAETLRQRQQRQQRIEQQKLNTDNPESRLYTTERWPVPSAAQQAQHVEAMKQAGSAIVERAGIDATFVETDRFLFYSEMEMSEALRWARLLDRCYEALADATGVNPATNIFHGKAIVFAFDDYDRFRVTEADTFNHLSPRSVSGLMHPDGPQVFINMHRSDDDVAFGELLCRLATYAFLHRLHAPRRLPAWANEGLALQVTREAFDLSTVEQTRRPFALKFVREHPGDVPRLLTLEYGDEHWPGPEKVGPAVGYLLVEMLLREDRQAFSRWAAAVKTGADWPEALSDAYGTPATTIVERFVRWYRVNN